MRSNILLAAPFIAAAGATTTSYGTTHVKEISGSVTITSVYSYSNPATSLLTQTNSKGVITGSPASPAGASTVNTASPVTTQPEVATIPAGLPKGINTVYLNESSTLSSFLVSVGKKTTEVVGGAVATSASVTTGPTNGVSGGGSGSGSGSSGSGSGSGSGSSDSSSSDAAPSAVKVASAVVIGLCAFVAALL